MITSGTVANLGNLRRLSLVVALAVSAGPVSAQPQPQPQPYPPNPADPNQPAPYPPGPYPQQPGPYQPPPPAVYGYTPTATGPDEIDYDGQRVPYGYTKIEKKRKGLIIGGAVTLGVTYFFSAMIGSIGEDLRGTNELSAMFIPVVGPFIQAGSTDSSSGKFWLVNLGLGQTAGAIMLVVGLTSPKTLLVRNDQVSLIPMTGNGTTGMLVSGQF